MFSDTELKGKFLVIEGPDGVGKTSVVERTAEILRADGQDVKTIILAQATELGAATQSFRVSKHTDGMAGGFLFLAMLRQTLMEQIVPHLQKGGTVISDRFLLSTYLYQVKAKKVFDREMFAIMVEHLQGDWCPTAYCVLHASDDALHNRLGGRGNLSPFDADNYLQKSIREGYRSFDELVIFVQSCSPYSSFHMIDTTSLTVEQVVQSVSSDFLRSYPMQL
jgi:thymidylate kinase